ncbi:hypothetical protein GLYMA_15G101700v4 [Glycine max]|nr:hypothetical protein GLYMA_15G101700v4 [Glycine max]
MCPSTLTARTEMAAGSDGVDINDAASPKTTTSKRGRFTTSTESRRQTLTSSSSHTHTLPIELIQEILQRLPVKFLLQLRCVCKSWKSLISHPQFAKNHLHSSPTATRLIAGFTNPAREFILRAYPLSDVFNAVAVNATELRYPFNNRKCYDFIVGSCDGILCFAVDQRRALLWNPSIGKFKKLPPLDNERRNGSYTIHGFGYDRFADSYKVVAIFCYECDGRYETQVKVLTLGTDSWRRIQEFPSGLPFDESGKFVSGTVNWLASNDSSSLIIVSLDLHKESYEEVLQPYYGVAVVNLTLGVLRDCLCVLSHADTFLDVWLMKDYGNKESWTKLFRVPYMGISDSYLYTKALCISEDDQVLMEFNSELAVYNSRNGTSKIPDIQDIYMYMTPEVYIESLISPCV